MQTRTQIDTYADDTLRIKLKKAIGTHIYPNTCAYLNRHTLQTNLHILCKHSKLGSKYLKSVTKLEKNNKKRQINQIIISPIMLAFNNSTEGEMLLSFPFIFHNQNTASEYKNTKHSGLRIEHGGATHGAVGLIFPSLSPSS